jgi:hypothetical protein
LNRARSQYIVRVRARAQHPFEHREPALLVRGRAAAPPYPAPSWLASRLTSKTPGRCFSPTSATDIPIRALVPRPIPAPAACAAKSASAMSSEREPLAIRRAASDRLATIRPRVELRLTTRLQLRTNHLRPSFVFKGVKSSARRQSFPGVAFSAALRAGDPASDAPCRAPHAPIAERLRSARTASTALASTRAASPIRGAFHRQVPPRRFRGGSPPPYLELCRPGPASGALSLLTLLSQGGARSRRWDGLFTRGRPDRALLANFCNRNEMRAQSLDRSNPAHRAGVAFGAAKAAGG